MSAVSSRATPYEFQSLPITLEDLAPRADAVIVVPPFAQLDFPHLGAHLLQGCARAAGFEVAVVYAGMFLAREIGQALYYALSEGVTPQDSGGRVFTYMLGERVFARAAYGVPLLGRRAEELLSGLHMKAGLGSRWCTLDFALLRRLAHHVEDWADRFAHALAARGYPIVGLTTVFEQTAASIAILSRIKALAPSTTTIIGGANCTGGMAEGVASLSDTIDYAFSGESERVFPAFLAGHRPAGKVIEGEPCMELDALPLPDYEQYYAQRRACLEDDAGSRELIMLPYESSRGCWWGQKHHCTFCGEATMRYREKSPDRLFQGLEVLLARHPSRRVFFVDEIMPHSYFKSVLPRIREKLPNVTMFYEQKANMTLEKVRSLREAGVSVVQPGIEALSSSLLRRMDKGILARQNLALLRYARSARLSLIWALLFGLPGDEPDDYADYLTLLPLLHHLEPPRRLIPLGLLRFSPYWKYPERYGIRNLRPGESYADVLPEGADASRVAYHFEGEFSSIATDHPELVKAIDAKVCDWSAAWSRADRKPPVLSVRRMGPDLYVLFDKRGLPGALEVQPISHAQVAATLVGRPLANLGDISREAAWAQANKYAVELDGWHAPLVTAEPDLLAEFERAYGPGAEGRVENGGELEHPAPSAEPGAVRTSRRRQALPVIR
jgi:ribosomal peptide maturation radical SAM protein 1